MKKAPTPIEAGDVVDESPESKHSQVIKIVLLVLAIAAFVMVCTGIGKTGPIGFGPQIIEDATAVSSGEHGTVIADSEGDRLLFTNSSGKLVGMYGIDGKETPITTATVIRQVGEDVFVAGVAFADDGQSIKAEAVLRFSMDGEYLGTVWKEEYEEDAVRAMRCVRDLAVDDNGNLVLIQFGKHEDVEGTYKGTITRVPKDGGDEQVLRKSVFTKDTVPLHIRYDPKDDRCAMTDRYGRLFVEQNKTGVGELANVGNRTLKVTGFDMSGSAAVLYDAQSHALLRTNNLFGNTQLQFEELDTGVLCNAVTVCGNTASAIMDNGSVRIYDLQAGSFNEMSEVPLVAPFVARSVALTLSKAYLAILFVVLAIRWVVRNIRQGRRDKVRWAVAATTVALICVAAMVFHTVGVSDAYITGRQINMSQIASQACITSPSELGDSATNLAKRVLGNMQPNDNNDDSIDVAVNLEGIAMSSSANGSGVLCTLYVVAQNGEVYALDSSGRNNVVMDSVRNDDLKSAINNAIKDANSHEEANRGIEKAYFFARDGEVQTVIRKNNSGRDVVSCVVPLFAKDGTCCTALEVSCHVKSVLYTIMDRVLGTLLMFLMTAISISIIFEELIRSGSVCLRFKKMQKEGVEWAEILMGRPLCVAISFAFSMDAAFAVLIGKEMISNSGMDPTPFMLGIPAFAITAGAAIGTLIHAIMCSRVSARSYALTMLLLGIAAQLLCFFAVRNTWFVVFVACKLISSASLATIQFVGKNRAGATHSKQFSDERLPLLVKRSPVNIASKGAAVVAGVVGGVLAYVGDQWVYMVSAVAGLAVIPILLIALPKGNVISKHGDRANLHSAFKFLTSPIMLVSLAFGILPTVLASGYKSIILPLFLDSAGVTKTDISCLFAVGNAILYVFSDPLITLRDKIGRWVFTWVGIMSLGVLFVVYSYNQAPIWAVVSVVLITVLTWFAGDWKHNARAWAKKDYGFSYDQSQTMLNTEESVVKNVQAPILTSLLSAGASVCCFVLGIFFIVSGVCYYFPTRKRKDIG